MSAERLESGGLSNWIAGSTGGSRWREMGWKAGGYSQRLKVWRLEAGLVARLRVAL
jgi:hypothetical protein